ncbi:MAG: hypothetical protein GY749_38970 [Desulfobacteraceae bacterium]|nr:hypothetical protein [Desulfobacteraceae bacterium]
MGWDEMTEEDMEFDIQQRVYHISSDEKIYLSAKRQAEKEHFTAEQIINMVLKREYAGI